MDDMEALLERLSPGHTRMAMDTPRPERVSVTRASLYPPSLVQSLMVSPFLLPSTAWHMMHTKVNPMGITQRVTPFVEWLKETTVELQQGIAALTIMDLADTMMVQRQGIRKYFPPHPPLHGHQARVCPFSNCSSCRQPRPHHPHQRSKR